MVKISQVGVGQKSSGTIDGITYYVRGDVTYARSKPNMPSRIYKTPAAKKRQAIFKMVQMHMKYHLNTLRKTITANPNSNSSNRYFKLNGQNLRLALDSLADRYVNGEIVTITDVEQAISKYAAEHPKSIKIASRSGYQEVYLTGEWPDVITLKASTGDNTMIIIVAENGTKTVIDPDGTTTVETGGNGSGGSNNSGGSQSGNNSGSNNEQDDDNGESPNI